MKPAYLAGVGCMLLVIGLGLGWWLRGTQDAAHEPAGTPAASSERKVLYWHDPMVPGQRFDKPGPSPFMDMDLVPVYADEASDSGVRIGSHTVQNLGMRLGQVERVDITPRFSAVGNVAFDERRVAVVQARVSGYISRLRVRTTLERVRKGQPLAELTSPEWLEAQSEYLALLRDDTLHDSPLATAARRRLIVLDVPQSVIATMERTRQMPPTTTLYSPIDGVVSEIGVREGASVESGSLLFQINALSSVWVNAQIPETQVSNVEVGAQITAHATSWPGETFRGRIEAMLPQVDATTRTLTVRTVLDNRAGKLAPGMFVTLDLAAAASSSQLVVPTEALIRTGQRTVVIAQTPAGTFEVMNVTPGLEQGERTVILAGLDAGQSIVLSGQFLIDSEASLKSTLDRLSGAPSEAPAQTPAADPRP